MSAGGGGRGSFSFNGAAPLRGRKDGCIIAIIPTGLPLQWGRPPEGAEGNIHTWAEYAVEARFNGAAPLRGRKV